MCVDRFHGTRNPLRSKDSGWWFRPLQISWVIFWQFPPSASRSFCPGTTKAGDCAAETVGRSVGQYVIQLTERVQVFSVSVKPPERRRA